VTSCTSIMDQDVFLECQGYQIGKDVIFQDNYNAILSA